MKERPILLTPENAQKCFEGVKTQTRRIVEPQPNKQLLCRILDGTWGYEFSGDDWRCPYGNVGDRLWIREAWAAYSGGVTIECEEYDLVEGPIAIDETGPLTVVYRGAEDSCPERWRSAMHMYRWACRTVVEITEIRVQRLQDLTAEDCQAEGVDCNCLEGGFDAGVAFGNFVLLWESISGAGSWDENPWVWAITFKKV